MILLVNDANILIDLAKINLLEVEHRQLWLHNSSDTLRFLVVDESHAFDGAQSQIK